MFKAANFNKLLTLLIIITMPGLSHAYNVYNKSSTKIRVQGSNNFDHIMSSHDVASCSPTNSDCYGDISLSVIYYSGRFRFTACQIDTYIPAKETGHFFLVNVTKPERMECNIKACRDGEPC